MIALALALAAGAQLTDPSDEDWLPGGVLVVSPRDELPITASAASVTVLDAEDLARTGEVSLPRAIGRAAGVFVQESNFGGGAPVLRGLLGNQVLILVDGVRLNDSTTRFGPNQSLNTIDMAIVERVEVHHGPASVLYGSDAIGGVIAIWTKRRAPLATHDRDSGRDRFAAAAEGLFDSATSGGRGALELSGAGSDYGWIGIAGAADWGDLRAGGGEEQPFTGYDSRSLFGSLEHALGEGRVLRVMSLWNRDCDVPRTFQVVPGFGQATAPFERYDFVLQERRQTVLSLEDSAGGGIADRMQLRLFARSYAEQRARRRTGSSSETFGETDVTTLGLGADFERALGEHHRLTFGLELLNDDVDSFNVQTDLATGTATPMPGDFAPDARYRTLGVFVQDEFSAFDPLLFTAGLRWSEYDFAFDAAGGRERGDFDALTASLEASLDVASSTRLTATLAQGFQAPNLEDLANDGDFAGGTELANPDLDAAESVTAELGVDVVESRWSGRAAVFATRIDDAIGRRLLDAGDPAMAGDELYMRANAGRVDLYGVEAGAALELFGAGSPWSVDCVASWVRGRQYDGTVDAGTGTAPLDGVEARRVPPLHGTAALRWRRRGEPSAAPSWLDEAALSLRWALEQEQLHPDDVTDPRIDPDGTDGWSTWNLELGGPVSRDVRWRVGLVNLLDERYRTHGSGIDGPGRSIVLTLRAEL